MGTAGDVSLPISESGYFRADALNQSPTGADDQGTQIFDGAAMSSIPYDACFVNDEKGGDHNDSDDAAMYEPPASVRSSKNEVDIIIPPPDHRAKVVRRILLLGNDSDDYEDANAEDVRSWKRGKRIVRGPCTGMSIEAIFSFICARHRGGRRK